MWSPTSRATAYSMGSQAEAIFEHIDVGNTTTATVPGLADGGTYFFVVTAYNTVMMESPPLNKCLFHGGNCSAANTNTNSHPYSNPNPYPDPDSNTNPHAFTNTSSDAARPRGSICKRNQCKWDCCDN